MCHRHFFPILFYRNVNEMAKNYRWGLLCILFISTQCIAQPGKEPEDANEFFKYNNYIMAMPIYKALIRKDPSNPEYNYRLGICYIETRINRLEAIPFLERVSKDPQCPPDTWFYLGKAYLISNQLDKAIAAYEKYKTLVTKDKSEMDITDHQIEMCENAKELRAKPVNVKFTNLGPEINTVYPDYFPWVTNDEQLLFFTSRRKGGHTTQQEGDGYYSSDLYVSAVNLTVGKWEKAKNLGTTINTNLDEEIVGISPDGKELVVYIDHIDQVEDLYTTTKKGNNYLKLEPMSENVNKEKEYSGSIANTENGQVLFFVRKDKTCIGLTDIFMSRRLPTGEWGPAFNLGPNINTKYKEDFPWLSKDGKTLYFSSEGHNSMGGFDIFKSVWDDDLQFFGPAQNLGYPVNTTDDEQQITILPDNRAGYLSAVRPEGLGDLDIYRIKFEDEEQPFNLVLGKIIPADSAKVKLVATIIAEDEKTHEQLVFKPTSSSGRFVMALHPGKYKITIDCEGYKKVSEDLVVFDIGTPPYKETQKDFLLIKN